MQITKYNPVRELEKMERDLAKLWEQRWGEFPVLADVPSVDMYEEGGKLVAEVKLPDFKKSEVHVVCGSGELEVSAKHTENKEKKSKRTYYFQESSNQYYRRISLPEGANSDKADATFKDGLLKVVLPMSTTNKSNEVVIN